MGSYEDPRDDDELLLATATGDGAAFAAFYGRHVAEVLAFLVRRVGSEEVAADLAGETFAAALLACGRYRADEAPALAWLLGIARNKLRESARRGSVEIESRQRLGIPAIAFEDEDILRVQELASVGEEALALLEQLPAAQRDAVRARVLEELDYERLALELGHLWGATTQMASIPSHRERAPGSTWRLLAARGRHSSDGVQFGVQPRERRRN